MLLCYHNLLVRKCSSTHHRDPDSLITPCQMTFQSHNPHCFSHMKPLLTSKHSLNPTPVQSFKLKFTKSCWQHRAQVKQHFRANTFDLTSLIHEEKKRSQSQKMRFFWLCLLMGKFTCIVLTEWAVRLLSACIGFSHKMQPASYSLWIFAAAVSGRIQGKVRTKSTLEVI